MNNNKAKRSNYRSGLSDQQRWEIFKELRKDPTSLAYHPDNELLEEDVFMENLKRHHPRIYRLLLKALEINGTHHNQPRR